MSASTSETVDVGSIDIAPAGDEESVQGKEDADKQEDDGQALNPQQEGSVWKVRAAIATAAVLVITIGMVRAPRPGLSVLTRDLAESTHVIDPPQQPSLSPW